MLEASLINMKVWTLPLLLLLMTSPSRPLKIDLCVRCICTRASASPSLDCSQRAFGVMPAGPDWPQFLREGSHVGTVLDFAFNNIRTVTQFPELRTVTELCLRHNKIDKLAEAAFLNLGSLRGLDLSHNELTGEEIRPDVFRGAFGNARYEPLGVTSLNLGFNRIRSVGPRAFEHLPDLEMLYLNSNPLVVLDAATESALALLPALKFLDLGYTRLGDLPDHLMRSLTGLKEIYLNGNQFKTVPESLAAVGGTLEKLNLNDNPVTSLDANSFLGLDHLRELNVSGCAALSEIRTATFAHLASLESLYLSFNFNLSFISPDAFRELRDKWPVKQLFLHQNGLTSLPENLVPWEELEVLDIQENPWRCDCELHWLAVRIVPMLRRKNPDMLTDIRCAMPKELRGEQLMTLNKTLLCGSPSDVMRWYRNRGQHIHPFTLAMLLLSILVVLVGLVALCRSYLMKRRNVIVMREVRYTRQMDLLEDEDYS